MVNEIISLKWLLLHCFWDTPTPMLKIPWHPAVRFLESAAYFRFDTWLNSKTGSWVRLATAEQGSSPCHVHGGLCCRRGPVCRCRQVRWSPRKNLRGRICLLLAACWPVRAKTTEHFAISSLKLHAGLQSRGPAPTRRTGRLHLALRTFGRDSLLPGPSALLSYLFLLATGEFLFQDAAFSLCSQSCCSDNRTWKHPLPEEIN